MNRNTVFMQGTRRFGLLWLYSNQSAVDICRANGIEPSENPYYNVLPQIVLGILDTLYASNALTDESIAPFMVDVKSGEPK